MDEAEFKRRTKELALAAIRLVDQLPRGTASSVIGRQLVRCMTSVGANYRASCRGRSIPEILAKLSIVEEEADEALYWLEMLEGAGLVRPGSLVSITDEANQILAMTVASKRTLKARIGDKGFAGPARRPNRESWNAKSEPQGPPPSNRES